MSLMDRIRKGTVAATLRFGVEEGITQVTRTRARQNHDGSREAIGRTAETAVDGDVGLPVGETAIEDLLKEGDRDEINGVSLAEMRYMAGIPDPFGPVKFDPSGLDFGELERFRGLRNTPATLHDARARRALVERAERDGVAKPDNRPRAYHYNPDPKLDDRDESGGVALDDFHFLR